MRRHERRRRPEAAPGGELTASLNAREAGGAADTTTDRDGGEDLRLLGEQRRPVRLSGADERLLSGTKQRNDHSQSQRAGAYLGRSQRGVGVFLLQVDGAVEDRPETHTPQALQSVAASTALGAGNP